jgi:hypothetical protein
MARLQPPPPPPPVDPVCSLVGCQLAHDDYHVVSSVCLGSIHQMFLQFFYELWKNCRKILQALVRQAAGKNPRSILRAQNLFYNFSTIVPQFFPAAYRARARKISSTIIP